MRSIRASEAHRAAADGRRESGGKAARPAPLEGAPTVADRSGNFIAGIWGMQADVMPRERRESLSGAVLVPRATGVSRGGSSEARERHERTNERFLQARECPLMAEKKNKALRILGALAAATLMYGCTSAPVASVSDPAVYTMTHVVSAANSVGD